MEYDPKTPQFNTSDETSFANDSVRTRWPIILAGAIEDVQRSLPKSNCLESQNEGKIIIEKLQKLCQEIAHGSKLTFIENDGHPEEISAINKEIEQRGHPSWSSVSWLFSECYMYRRINSFFNPTKYWQNHDVFARQKMDTFRSSRNAVFELANRYRELMQILEQTGRTDGSLALEQEMFIEIFEICLWGNATDLSLLTNLTYEDIQKLQGAKARKAAEENILINHLPQAYGLLKKAQSDGNQTRRVDIVLDNAGFELYVDLILAGFLLTTGLATEVVLHPKSMPWFVSDVVPHDFDSLMDAISDPMVFFDSESNKDNNQPNLVKSINKMEEQDLLFVSTHWKNLVAKSQLTLAPHRYWTAVGSFWRLPEESPHLFKDLKSSELVIFKGDLNYRKLTGDAQWETTTPFSEAIGPLGPCSGINILSLRTCKADVVVGLKPGQDEDLKQVGGDAKTGARKWAWHGKWATISLSAGTKLSS